MEPYKEVMLTNELLPLVSRSSDKSVKDKPVKSAILDAPIGLQVIEVALDQRSFVTSRRADSLPDILLKSD